MENPKVPWPADRSVGSDRLPPNPWQRLVGVAIAAALIATTIRNPQQILGADHSPPEGDQPV